MKWVQIRFKQWIRYCFNFCLATVSGLNPTFQTIHPKGKSGTVDTIAAEVLDNRIHTHYRVGCGSQVCMDIWKKDCEYEDSWCLLHVSGQELHSRPFWYRSSLADFWVCNDQWFHSTGLNATILRIKNFNLHQVNVLHSKNNSAEKSDLPWMSH